MHEFIRMGFLTFDKALLERSRMQIFASKERKRQKLDTHGNRTVKNLAGGGRPQPERELMIQGF
jgi:hypothetical protein